MYWQQVWPYKRRGKQTHFKLLSTNVRGGSFSKKRSYFSRFTQEICSSNKGCRTNKQVSGRVADGGGAKAGTIRRAAGPPDKSPCRCPYLNTAEPLGSIGKPGPPEGPALLGLLTWSARWTEWRMGSCPLSKQVKAGARRPEQVLHSLPGFHKEEDSWLICCTGVNLLTLQNGTGWSMRLAANVTDVVRLRPCWLFWET